MRGEARDRRVGGKNRSEKSYRRDKISLTMTAWLAMFTLN